MIYHIGLIGLTINIKLRAMNPSFSGNLTNTTETYFTDPELLENVPTLMLYMAACYAVIFCVGVIMLVEKPVQDEKKELDHEKRLRDSWAFFYQDTLTRKDFYLLWMTRFLLLLLNSGILSYWKSFREVFEIYSNHINNRQGR